MIQETTTFTSSDGKTFTSRERAETWQKRLDWCADHIDSTGNFTDDTRRQGAISRLARATEEWDKHVTGDAGDGIAQAMGEAA